MLVRVSHLAVQDWQQLIDRGASPASALRALFDAVRRSRVLSDHDARSDGRELWRGPEPLDARVLVERHADRCDVIAVLPADGVLRRPLATMRDEGVAGTIVLPARHDPSRSVASGAGAPSERPASSVPRTPAAPIASLRRPARGRRALLGKMLQQEREAQGRTTRELAERAALDEGVVLDLERGYGATDEALARVCEALGVALMLRPDRPG